MKVENKSSYLDVIGGGKERQSVGPAYNVKT